MKPFYVHWMMRIKQFFAMENCHLLINLSLKINSSIKISSLMSCVDRPSPAN